MSLPDVNILIDEYWKWLRQETELREGEGFVEITSPVLDHHNDYIQIYAVPLNGGWRLTDDGYTLRDLASSGCDVSTDKRQELLGTTLRRLGVELVNGELVSRTTARDFPRNKHALLQAVTAVGDLFYTSSANVVSLFLEEVQRWLQLKHIRHTESVKFAGKTGYDHHFDFVIPSSLIAPERVLKVINRPDRANVERLLMAWNDTREVRPRDSKAVAVLNDETAEPTYSVVDALRNYEVDVIPWSHREEHVGMLAA